MAIKSEAEIYKLIEQYLKESDTPQTSTMLWERKDIRDNARSPEKVSDYLGLMWRRGILQRWDTPATATSRARYAYTWKEQESVEPKKVERLTPVPSSYKKSNVVITEDNERIILDFDKFTVIIQAKN